MFFVLIADPMKNVFVPGKPLSKNHAKIVPDARFVSIGCRIILNLYYIQPGDTLRFPLKTPIFNGVNTLSFGSIDKLLEIEAFLFYYSDWEGIILGRVIVLLLLIIILAAGGIVWFDYLNIIDAKTLMAPALQLVGLAPRSQPEIPEDALISLDAERLAVRIEALELRNLELDQREETIASEEGRILQMSQELEDRQKALDDRENSIIIKEQETDARNANIEAIARNLIGMPPENAVAILAQTNDQDAIDILRMTEAISASEGTASIVPYWMSLLPPEQAAELQRKMAGKPLTLN
jgi:flagellar protein FlbB